MIRNLIGVFVLVTIFAFEVHAATMEFDSVADTMLWKHEPTTNYTSDWSNGAGIINPPNYGDGAFRHTIIQFNVSMISSLSTISSATLKLYGHYVTLYNGTASFPLEVHGLTTPWVDGDATWVNAQDGVPWNSEGGDYGPVVDTQDIVKIPKSEDYAIVEFDITSLVADWVENPSANFGLTVIGTEQPQYAGQPLADQPVGVILFISSASSNEAAHPLLTVEYAASTVPEPASIILLMAGIAGLVKRKKR